MCENKSCSTDEGKQDTREKTELHGCNYGAAASSRILNLVLRNWRLFPDLLSSSLPPGVVESWRGGGAAFLTF